MMFGTLKYGEEFSARIAARQLLVVSDREFIQVYWSWGVLCAKCNFHEGQVYVNAKIQALNSYRMADGELTPACASELKSAREALIAFLERRT